MCLSLRLNIVNFLIHFKNTFLIFKFNYLLFICSFLYIIYLLVSSYLLLFVRFLCQAAYSEIHDLPGKIVQMVLLLLLPSSSRYIHLIDNFISRDNDLNEPNIA